MVSGLVVIKKYIGKQIPFAYRGIGASEPENTTADFQAVQNMEGDTT